MKTDGMKLVTFRLGRTCSPPIFFRSSACCVTSPRPPCPTRRRGLRESSSIVARSFPSSICVAASSWTPHRSLPTTRILVLNATDGWVGTIVDAVIEVAGVPATSITPPPPLFRGLAAQFVRGIAKVGEQLVVVLDVDRVLSSDDRIVLERAMGGAETLLRG